MTADKPTILLVEDNPSDCIVMGAALEAAGLNHSLQLVGDGEEAINYLAGEGEFADRLRFPFPRLVLLDLGLPKKTGFEVLEWIGQLPFPAQFDVVVISASTAHEDLTRAYDLGARSFIVKPENPEALVELVKPLDGYLHRRDGDILPLNPTIVAPLVEHARASSGL